MKHFRRIMKKDFTNAELYDTQPYDATPKTVVFPPEIKLGSVTC